MNQRYTAKDHTFVICAYKESRYLEECIQSVLGQKELGKVMIATATPNKYIAGLAEKYNIPSYINANGGEIAKDWNFAISLAKTPLVTLVHQDDIYEEKYLEWVLNGINQFRHPLIAFTDYGEIRDGKKVISNRLLKVKRIMLFPLKNKIFQRSRFIRRRSLSLGSAISCPTVTYVKDSLPMPIFESGFRSDLDWQAWEKLSRLKGAFVYCDKILVYHRIHEESATSKIIADNDRTKEDYQMFCKFWPKWIARMIEYFYCKSENSNSSQQDGCSGESDR